MVEKSIFEQIVWRGCHKNHAFNIHSYHFVQSIAEKILNKTSKMYEDVTRLI